MVPDLVVIGGGPAGMAAAGTALTAGLRVTVIDAGHALGGQFWRHPAPGDVRVTRQLHHDLDTYAALVRHLRPHIGNRLDLRLQHHVWTVVRSGHAFDVEVLDRSAGPGSERAVTIHGRRLLIATGSFDRQIPFPGWDLPGVFTAGGLQALLKGNGVAAGSRIAIGGTGPFLLPVASGLAEAGAQVVGVFEANPPSRWVRHAMTVARVPAKGVEALQYAGRLARHRVPVHPSMAVVEAHGVDHVEAVTVARLDRTGRVERGSERRIPVDAVGVGWGFVPQLDLAVTLGCELADGADGNRVVRVDSDQSSSVPGVFVAGEVTGVGGARLAVCEGQLAVEGVLGELWIAPVTPAKRLAAVRREAATLRAFAVAMHLAHPVPRGWPSWLRPDTTVCRCEEVTMASVRASVLGGAADGRQVKELTRAGMGWCQGRMCGYATDCLSDRGATTHPPVERLAATPIPLDSLTDSRY